MANTYLTRTAGSTGNRRTWTFSAWVKLGSGSGAREIFLADRVTPLCSIGFNSSDQLQIYFDGAGDGHLRTTQLFRDKSAWYHLHIKLNTIMHNILLRNSSFQ